MSGAEAVVETHVPASEAECASACSRVAATSRRPRTSNGLTARLGQQSNACACGLNAFVLFMCA